MKVFLTKVDRDIEKNIQRDPLSQQVIWTYYASQIYPNINSVTNDIKGYIITSLWKYIFKKYYYETFCAFQENEIRKIYVVYEMLVIYILVESEQDISFIGKEKGKKIYDEYKGNPRIDVNGKEENQKRILVRQEYLGYIGRYKTKVENIKTNFENEILKVAFGENLDLIADKFYNILKVYNKKIEYKDCFFKEFKDIFLEGLKVDEKQKERYLNILEIKDGNQNGLNYIFKCIYEKKELDAKDIVDEVLKNKKLDLNIKNKITNIRLIENFLTALNNLFYEILSHKKIDDIIKNDEIKKMIKILQDAYENIEKNDDTEQHKKKYIKEWYKEICENIIKSGNEINDEEIKNIIFSIIESHIRLQKNSNKKPWIEIDKENQEIKINHIVEHKYNERWEHDYYIYTIRNLVRSMEEWKENY